MQKHTNFYYCEKASLIIYRVSSKSDCTQLFIRISGQRFSRIRFIMLSMLSERRPNEKMLHCKRYIILFILLPLIIIGGHQKIFDPLDP